MKLQVKKTKYPSIYKLGKYWIDGQDAKEVDWKVLEGGDDPFDGEWVDSFPTKKLAVDFVKQELSKNEGTKMKSLKEMIEEADSAVPSNNLDKYIKKVEEAIEDYIDLAGDQAAEYGFESDFDKIAEKMRDNLLGFIRTQDSLENKFGKLLDKAEKSK